MGVLITKKVYEVLQDKGLGAKILVVDGSFFETALKKCGCCGPPPSLDYKVDFLDEILPEYEDPAKFTRVGGRMPAIVDRLLLSAAEAAGQEIIVMTEEDTSRKVRVYARIT
ncbi:MAG TPA: hypothetical protein VKK79_14290 [Candidatus Lokiarchaeia archaeon]|nr:hypothetical protein [Candidatus Lokiarchaeia archaeon]